MRGAALELLDCWRLYLYSTLGATAKAGLPMAAPRQIGAAIAEGSTKGLVDLSITDSNVLVMCFVAEPDVNPENRWTLGFSYAVHVAFDAIEAWLQAHPNENAALLTCSASDKFFSNGIDPEWMAATAAAGDPAQQLADWNDLTMPCFARPILLPIPTVCCLNGHAFGAGLMHALGHDYRIQRSDRGFLCAPEIAIGIDIPPPELELFRYAMPPHAFNDTVLSARRWSGPESLANGIVCATHDGDKLWSEALRFAEQQTKLSNRRVMGSIKGRVKGHVARVSGGSHASLCLSLPLPPLHLSLSLSLCVCVCVCVRVCLPCVGKFRRLLTDGIVWTRACLSTASTDRRAKARRSRGPRSCRQGWRSCAIPWRGSGKTPAVWPRCSVTRGCSASPWGKIECIYCGVLPDELPEHGAARVP